MQSSRLRLLIGEPLRLLGRLGAVVVVVAPAVAGALGAFVLDERAQGVEQVEACSDGGSNSGS